MNTARKGKEKNKDLGFRYCKCEKPGVGPNGKGFYGLCYNCKFQLRKEK